MSEHTEASPPEAVAEPSLAELFDPAALERRLENARVRRAEAIARRTAAEGEAPKERQPRAARVRTIDMAADMAAAPGQPAPQAPLPRDVRVPLSLVQPPRPVRAPDRLVPSAHAAAEPPLAARPSLQGERCTTTTMPERLAAAVARQSAGSPEAATAARVAPLRRPLAILGLGVLLGAVAAGATLVALRQSAPELAPPPASTAAVTRPALRFEDATASNATRLGYALPSDGVSPIASVVDGVMDGAPVAPDDAALPAFALIAPPASPAPASPPSVPLPDQAAVAALSSVDRLPPLDLPPDASGSPAEADAPALTPVAPDDAAPPASSEPASPPSVPLPGQAAVANLSTFDRLPPLDLPRVASASPQEADAPALSPVTLALPAPEAEGPAPSLPALAAPRVFPGRAIAAAPVPPAEPEERLRFLSELPDAPVRVALTLPGGLRPEPPLAFALAEEPDAPAAERAPTRPATLRRPVREKAPSPPRAAEVHERRATAAPTPARTAAASPANRERLERAVEDMLRDRLLGN